MTEKDLGVKFGFVRHDESLNFRGRPQGAESLEKVGVAARYYDYSVEERIELLTWLGMTLFDAIGDLRNGTNHTKDLPKEIINYFTAYGSAISELEINKVAPTD